MYEGSGGVLTYFARQSFIMGKINVASRIGVVMVERKDE
jgi:hypothetical protein